MLEMKIIGLTGLLFRGDAKLARECGLAGVCVWKGGTFVWGGDAELAHSAIPLGVFVSLWVE